MLAAIDVATGAVAQRVTYDEFGRSTLLDGQWDAQPFGFAGGLFDPETALVRFGARDYDPQIGRWTSPDPAGFEGGDSNLYAYVINDPINRVDADGRIAVIGILIGVGVELGLQALEN